MRWLFVSALVICLVSQIETLGPSPERPQPKAPGKQLPGGSLPRQMQLSIGGFPSPYFPVNLEGDHLVYHAHRNVHDEKGYGLKNGDTIKATIVGNTITVFINGVQKAQATDNTFQTGNPGIGAFLQCAGGEGKGTNADFGFTSFTAQAMGQSARLR